MTIEELAGVAHKKTVEALDSADASVPRTDTRRQHSRDAREWARVWMDAERLLGPPPEDALEGRVTALEVAVANLIEDDGIPPGHHLVDTLDGTRVVPSDGTIAAIQRRADTLLVEIAGAGPDDELALLFVLSAVEHGLEFWRASRRRSHGDEIAEALAERDREAGR